MKTIELTDEEAKLIKSLVVENFKYARFILKNPQDSDDIANVSNHLRLSKSILEKL